MSSGVPTPPSPGVGLRRKGPKNLPKLPLSAFTPPASGTADQFPRPDSPSKLHPEKVVDARVLAHDGDVQLAQWKKEAGKELESRIGGVVVTLPAQGLDDAISQIKSAQPTELILSVAVPFSLGDTDHDHTATILSSLTVPRSLSTSFVSTEWDPTESLRWALQQGVPVDIDVHTPLDDQLFEKFEEILTKATDRDEDFKAPPIILSNLLPPPDDLELPIVKLLNHPTYLSYQRRIASLSLFPTVHVKFLPPAWNSSSVPATPAGVPVPEATDATQNRERKKRIKMYLGPVMEAFGFRRIMFGSSPSESFSSTAGGAGEWYQLARESFAELAVEQEDIDEVFYGTAKRVYGS